MGGLKRVARRFDDWLSAIDWRDFERLLAEHYRQAGFVVQECGTANGQQRFGGGVDLRLFRGNETTLVQCKRWTAMKVAHNPVHELLGIVVAQNATRGILVNSGEFTEAAKRAAANSGGRIELVDGAAVRDVAPARGLDIAGALTSGLAGYRRVQRAWWRTNLIGGVLSLGLLAIGVTIAWSLIQQAIGNLQAGLTRQTQTRVVQPKPPQRAIATRSPPVARMPALSPAEREMRRELVRSTARGFNGVTSAVWLSERALFLGMGPATQEIKAAAGRDACDLLSRYPELPQLVEIQQTSGTSDGRVARVACPGARRLASSEVHLAVPPEAKPVQPEIVMYGSPNCTYCRQAEAYFARRGLGYRNLDITASRQAHQDFKRLGGQGTPLILVNGRRIHGFSAKRMDAALAAARG
jgi:glutaredoxin